MEKIETLTQKPLVDFTINETVNRFLSMETEVALDTSITTFYEYTKNNPGTGLSEEDKDIIYVNAQELLKNIKKLLRDAKFFLYLNRNQFKTLTDIILKKLEYDVNTVFVALELNDLLGSMAYTKYKDNDELHQFEMDATQITYVYHLISKHTIRGLTNETHYFAQILLRIGELSKIINYYDTTAKNAIEDFTNWTYRFSPVQVEGNPLPSKEEVMEAITDEDDGK